jgi:hypothetical protein
VKRLAPALFAGPSRPARTATPLSRSRRREPARKAANVARHARCYMLGYHKDQEAALMERIHSTAMTTTTSAAAGLLAAALIIGACGSSRGSGAGGAGGGTVDAAVDRGTGGQGGGGANLGQSYPCTAPDAGTLNCVVGQSFCEIFYGRGGTTGPARDIADEEAAVARKLPCGGSMSYAHSARLAAGPAWAAIAEAS